MESSIWQSSKHQTSSRYVPRSATDNALYRVVYEYRDEFEHSWEELFESKYGKLRRSVLSTFDAFCDCGIFAHGCARIHCSNCNHSELLPFSCKKTHFCPSCSAKHAHMFAENLHGHILFACSHRHLVWSIPKRLRLYYRFDRSLLASLHLAAWGSWCELIKSHCKGARSASVSSLHCAGDLLNFHPHIHSLNLNGYILESGEFVELQEIDTDFLEREFRVRVFDSLVSKGLLSEEVVESMKTWEHSGFSVFSGEPLCENDEESRLFVSRYLGKCAISLKRLRIVEDESEPKVVCVKELDDGEIQERAFTPLEFLAEISCIIPDTYEQNFRFYGLYSARTRGANRAKEKQICPDSEVEEGRGKVSYHWAYWIKKVYEYDPLTCPKCGSLMKVKALIFDLNEIDRFTKHLGIASWCAPPSLRGEASRKYH